MATMRGLGCAVGDYVGDGKGDTENELPAVDLDMVDADAFGVDQSLDEEEGSPVDAHPLLILFDCETTGLSIYNEHITDIAAKVINSPVDLSAPTFSSLVRTSRHIQAAGKVLKQIQLSLTCMCDLLIKLPRLRVSVLPHSGVRDRCQSSSLSSWNGLLPMFPTSAMPNTLRITLV